MIGGTLATEQRGRPAHDPPRWLLEKILDDMTARLTPFLIKTKALTQQEQESAFKEKFPDLKSYVDWTTFKHHSPKEIVQKIFCAKHNIAERTLYLYKKP